MKIDLNVLSEKQTETTVNQTKMRLSENAASMVFQMFTKNIYSNPIGTVVREITSNCFDSHVEANVKAPVLIKKIFDNQTQTHYISFIDYGMGMSPDRINNIYAVYFESTKRADNQQIGGFGIGAKSVLAYKRPTGHGQGEYDNSFYVITVFDKMKYYYCIFEGEESPVISLLHSEPTTERNGTEVRIPVLEKDLNTFSKEMVRQLYYFENIIFEGFEDQSYGSTLSNEYQIIRTKTFLYRGTEYASTMHVCLGRVAYPIDYNVLGLNSNDYYLPVALRLEVGDINVVASREQLDYNENTIKVLKKKLEAAKAEIIAMLTKQYDNIITLKDYFQYQNEFGKLVFPNKTSLNVGSLIKKKDIDLTNFKYDFLKMPNDRQLFYFFFGTKKLGKNTNTRYSRRNEFDNSYSELISRNDLYYIENEFVRKVAKASYLNSLHGNYFIISKRNITLNSMRSDIAELFNVHLDSTVDDNGKPVTFVQNLLEMQEEYFDIVRENAENYDEIEVPEEFLRRKKRNVLDDELRKTKIPVKLLGGWSSKKRIKLDELFKFKGTIFYGVQDDEYSLNNAVEIFKRLFNSNLVVTSYDEYDNKFYYDKKNGGGIAFMMFSKINVKYMQYCKKAYHINEFYHRMLYRKADIVHTYFQVHDIIEKYGNLKDLYRNTQFSQINKKWGNVINEVKTFVEAIPEKNSELGYIKSKLSKYFNLDNVRPTNEQKKILRKIESLYELDKKNNKILDYISRYSFSTMDDVLINILKKIMVF
jgi:hypothetical protein